MSDYGIEQEIGQAVVKAGLCPPALPNSMAMTCARGEVEGLPDSDDCRLCWHEWAKGVLKGEK